MKKHWQQLSASLISIGVLLSLGGCSTWMSSQMPETGISMQQAYNSAINGSGKQGLTHARSQIHTLRAYELQASRTGNNRLASGSVWVHRLPNPNVQIYVFPHYAGEQGDKVPIPGYATVFPLYQKNYYEQSY